MFVTMVVAALIVDGLFSAAGLIPTGPRPTRARHLRRDPLDYKLVLNVLGARRLRGAVLADRPPRRDRPGLRDEGRPRQGAPLDFGEQTFYFCSEHCLHAFEASPGDVRSAGPGLAAVRRRSSGSGCKPIRRAVLAQTFAGPSPAALVYGQGGDPDAGDWVKPPPAERAVGDDAHEHRGGADRAQP